MGAETPPLPLSVSGAIRHVEVDGLRVILDLRTESYKVLDEIASAFWCVLTGAMSADAALRDLCQTYAVDEAQFMRDLGDFAQDCLTQRLLIPNDAKGLADWPRASTRVRTAGPGLIGALRALIETRAALRRSGFGAVYAAYSAAPVVGSAKSIAAAAASFLRAESLYVAGRAPDDCLLRSLAMYRFLRGAGLPAEHVIGVRRLPFQAHAWVECHGASVLDPRVAPYRPIARMGGASAAEVAT